ncbi:MULTISPECIES: hypothetical protein [Streptomyces]|uniref:hypothetical protein n=1 Tax=Streptomyces TaxID=1883 RepID=UPI0004CD8AD2|nr:MULTISPECIES: hypothetical protein [Streptomyces]KOT62926.1 hypothetical protein ADK43_09060 [Streptomyces rimosus subsp. rimosus]
MPKQTTPVPGLTINESMYEAAVAGIAAHASDLALAWERFTAPTSWWLIPDESGLASRAELTLRETQQSTIRINIWMRADLRGPGGTPLPHSHPWSFESHILMGAYDEDRYRLTDDGQVHSHTGVTHQGGTTNRIDRAVYHEVRHIHAPGATLSLMKCGRGERGAWGYLDLAAGRHLPAAPDPCFTAKLKALNPQH